MRALMIPGDLLHIVLTAKGLTQKEFARLRMRPAQAISEIVRGKKMITPEMATELEHAYEAGRRHERRCYLEEKAREEALV